MNAGDVPTGPRPSATAPPLSDDLAAEIRRLLGFGIRRHTPAANVDDDDDHAESA